ncbi:MAG: hypothetical protein ACYC4N_07595 [Pirellulaceae bacterium]
MFDLPESLAGELEPARRVTLVLFRGERHLHRLAEELGMLIGNDLLFFGVADINVAVLDDKDRPATA